MVRRLPGGRRCRSFLFYASSAHCGCLGDSRFSCKTETPVTFRWMVSLERIQIIDSFFILKDLSYNHPASLKTVFRCFPPNLMGFFVRLCVFVCVRLFTCFFKCASCQTPGVNRSQFRTIAMMPRTNEKLLNMEETDVGVDVCFWHSCHCIDTVLTDSSVVSRSCLPCLVFIWSSLPTRSPVPSQFTLLFNLCKCTLQYSIASRSIV